jgi:RNA polymerase sigma factor (sigma-70 family)
MEKTTDADLVQPVRDGDVRAFAELFERHGRRVLAHCFRRTADHTLAEDCLSMVFLEAWRHRRGVRLAGHSLLPWLLAVANNVLRNQRRSLRRYRAALGRVPAQPAEPDFAEDVAGRLDDQRRMRTLVDLVGRLGQADRDVLELCVWDGLTYEEAAVAMGVAVGTVRSRLSRARERLRQLEAGTAAATGGDHW